MNVRDNVAYGLKVKGVAKAQRHARAEEALGMVALAGYGERKPCSCPAGSASAWPWPARWSIGPGTAARRAPRRAGPQAARADAGRAEEAPASVGHHTSSSSPTTRPRRCRCPTAWPCSTAGASNRSTPAQPLHATGHPVRRRVRRHLQRGARRAGPAPRWPARTPFSIRPEHIRLARRPPWRRPEAAVGVLLHDIQYPGQHHPLRTAAGQTAELLAVSRQ